MVAFCPNVFHAISIRVHQIWLPHTACWFCQCVFLSVLLNLIVVICLLLEFYSNCLLCVMTQIVNLWKPCSKSTVIQLLFTVSPLPKEMPCIMHKYECQRNSIPRPLQYLKVYSQYDDDDSCNWRNAWLFIASITMKWTIKCSCHLKVIRDLMPRSMKVILISSFTQFPFSFIGLIETCLGDCKDNFYDILIGSLFWCGKKSSQITWFVPFCG